MVEGRSFGDTRSTVVKQAAQINPAIWLNISESTCGFWYYELTVNAYGSKRYMKLTFC
jgi:hypothetical protein